jgi:23S rRNA pseudouridine2605 synthase
MHPPKPPKRSSRSRARSWHRPPTGPVQQPSLALQQITESLAPPRHRSSTDTVFAEPQRLHKILASCGFGSRRAMEDLILAGRITVNREPADVGQKVGPGDEVRINGELVKVRFSEPRPRILMYHKPAGEIVTRDDPEGRPTVFEQLPNIGNGKWIAIGRLDFNTEGLLLFTNSGELANKMMHPRYEVEREYAVRVVGTLTDEQQKSLLNGIELEDGPAKVEALEDRGGEGTNHWYHIVLKEGRNREVRRLMEALGLGVSRLIRTRYGMIAMPPRVKRGQMQELTPEEVGAVLTAAGMRSTGPAPQQKQGPGGKRQGRHPEQGQKPRGQRPQGQAGGQGPHGPRPPRGDEQPFHAAEVDDDIPEDDDAIQPGNSVHGNPTHGNRPVSTIFGQKGSGAGARYRDRARGPGAGGGGGNGFRGQGGGGAYRGQGAGAQRPPRAGGKGPRMGSPQGSGSPYVMTTLTIPGAVPEGLPGTVPGKPRGPKGGPHRPKGAGKGFGPNQGQGQGQGKNRNRGRRNRGGPNANRNAAPAPPGAPAAGGDFPDDNIGNK